MEYDLKIGTTVWIEHTDQGDITHRVKLILEKKPQDTELCKVCGQGHLTVHGLLIQHGILDDKIYAVSSCGHCEAITAFVYHVEARNLYLPEEGHDASE